MTQKEGKKESRTHRLSKLEEVIELAQIHLVLLSSDLIGEPSRALAKVVVWHDVRKESLDRLYDVELPWGTERLACNSGFLRRRHCV